MLMIETNLTKHWLEGRLGACEDEGMHAQRVGLVPVRMKGCMPRGSAWCLYPLRPGRMWHVDMILDALWSTFGPSIPWGLWGGMGVHEGACMRVHTWG